MKFEEGVRPVCSVSVSGNGGRSQRLVVESSGALVVFEGSARLRSWPLHIARLRTDLPNGEVSIEMGGETMKWICSDESRLELSRAAVAVTISGSTHSLSEVELGALLEDTEIDDGDAEKHVKQLGEKLAQLDALNVGGMLAAATEGGGSKLAARLEEGSAFGAALSVRVSKLEALTRLGGGAIQARSGAARADTSARALRAELAEIYDWLDAPALADLDSLQAMSLGSVEGRARALAAAEALRSTLKMEKSAPVYRLRLTAVRERLRRLARARDQLAAALARHLNNALIHLANEAHTPGLPGAGRRHHGELQSYAPFMRWLRDMDERAYDALVKVYVGTWSKVYEREVGAACDAARTSLYPDQTDTLLSDVLTLVETICNNEQDFCTQFFALDVDPKESSDGEKSESGGGEGRQASDTRRLMADLFPTLEQQLVTLLAHVERDPYGAMRALACLGRRVLGEAAADTGEKRWARLVLAAAAVAAKRGADRSVTDRLATLPEHVKQAAKKPKCGIFAFIPELEEMSAVCESIFAGGRRADLDRWYLSLCTAMVATIGSAEHPRTPREIVHLENFHRLHAAVCALRVPALDALRRETRRRYTEALRRYVTQYFGRPLDKITQFFEGVSEAVAAGAREEEVCYRAAYSKHALRKLLALYPAGEVRRALHRLYRTVEKHLSEECGLLQVVWRAMQEEFMAQHVALQSRIAACYPGAGLALPLTTQDILDAFSDIAREH
ncbi:unnamed protein product [Leptosia nina]|uniref:Exocyst complex component Sec3 C-terminal domain-containing protein n=1 Tax=Leptosia nina TaxID=320188 RepID=A0AAV1JZX2_9NEOP